MSSTITINGVTVRGGTHVVIGRNNIVIDGRAVDHQAIDISTSPRMDVHIEGKIGHLEVHDGSATVQGVTDRVSAGGSVTVKGGVGGSVQAGGSIRCGKVGGSIQAGGSVRVS